MFYDGFCYPGEGITVLRRILAAQDASAKEGRGREPDGYPIGRRGDHCVLRRILLPSKEDHCVLRGFLAAQDASAKEGRGREPDGYPIGRRGDHCVFYDRFLLPRMPRQRKGEVADPMDTP